MIFITQYVELSITQERIIVGC